MSHVTCMQGNRVDSRLLVVGSQTANLTPGPSFGHNLCFRCPNGSYKPILNIYVSINFQWYKDRLNPLSFGPCNHSLNIQESTETLAPKLENSHGSVKVHSFTLSFTLGVLLLACNLVSPCLGHEPKTNVATFHLMIFQNISFYIFFSIINYLKLIVILF
jgi:hypothetical protein